MASFSCSVNRRIFVLAASAGLFWRGSIAFAEPPIAAPTPLSGPSPLRPEDVSAMRQALDRAGEHGLDPKALIPVGIEALLASPDPDKRKRGEAALQAAVLRYARQVRSGRLDARDFDDEWALRPAAFDPKPGLDAALAQNTVAAWLSSLPPQHAGYKLAVKQLGLYRALAAKGGWDRVPAGPKLEPGAQDKRLAALRARLAIEDPSAPAAGPDALDPPLVEALKAFQRRHGLPEDGVLGAGTVAALNVPAERRVAQIEANLERWRWLPDPLPADRVDVNVPAALTTLVKGGEVALVMKAAPGRKTDHTPMLQSTISAIVLNPPWNIPQSIAESEILPKERAHPGYLQEEEIEVIDTPDGGRRLQQKAGSKSALGQVKFEFDNRFGVYLHDTPAKVAFDRTTRMVSHGCVRLEKPRELAAQLLQGQAGWSPDSLAMAIDAGDTKRVALDRPMPVFLFYWTAYVGPDGQMIFYPDPYGWDDELLKKIAAKTSSRV